MAKFVINVIFYDNDDAVVAPYRGKK